MVGAVDLTTEDEQPTKKLKQDAGARLPSRVWVLTKADHASCGEQLAQCTVIGTYVTEAAAQQAKARYLEEGGWQQGYGYHQGEDAESAIEIESSALHL